MDSVYVYNMYLNNVFTLYTTTIGMSYQYAIAVYNMNTLLRYIYLERYVILPCTSLGGDHNPKNWISRLDGFPVHSFE